MPTARHLLKLVAAIASAAILSGCGQSGPLYLPNVPKAPAGATQTAPAATPSNSPQTEQP